MLLQVTHTTSRSHETMRLVRKFPLFTSCSCGWMQPVIEVRKECREDYLCQIYSRFDYSFAL